MNEEIKSGILSKKELQQINDYLDSLSKNNVKDIEEGIENKKESSPEIKSIIKKDAVLRNIIEKNRSLEETVNDESISRENYIQAVNRGISKGREENIEAQEKFIRETKQVADMVNSHSKIVLNDALLKIGSGEATRDDYPNIPELQNIKEGEPTDSEKFISHVMTGGNASSYDEMEKFMNTDFGNDEYTIKPKR